MNHSKNTFRIRALIASLLLLSLAFPAFGACYELPTAKAESVGMSTERLERIGAWLDGIIEDKKASGFVTLVARRGKVVHYEARGTRGLSVSDPMPADAIFDLASMTKAVTVVAALMLLDEGRFALNDPVSDYLPSFKNPKVASGADSSQPAEHEITIANLFTHSSGVRGSQGTLFWIDPAEELTVVLMVQATPRPGMRLREKFADIIYSAILD